MPKQSAQRAKLPIERIIVDECLGQDAPMLTQLAQRLGDCPFDSCCWLPSIQASRTSRYSIEQRSQALLEHDYKFASTLGTVVVFARDNIERKLVSYTVSIQ